jgi:hypothetical protein
MECNRENLERCQEKCWFKPMEVGSVPSQNVGLIYLKKKKLMSPSNMMISLDLTLGKKNMSQQKNDDSI